MKTLLIVLVLLFGGLQYKLWFDRGGIYEVQHLKNAITQQTKENKLLQQRNTVLAAEIEDLKTGQMAIEERARNDLAMTKSGEVFYQVMEK